ncbi:MAG: YbgC/FadM family acyl-CoA thioesterase [Bacteroidia bacterium]|jgi:acyl-CoA thioester hydrolase|nr:YbgC/FadM family acyl-CoA thioesterase [Bacteroidia bacterium]
MAHKFDVRVYYSDTDAGQIVYHGRYLDFAEHARTELFRSLAQGNTSLMEMIDNGVGFVVKSINVVYHQVAVLDDLLTVISTIKNSKRFSLTFLQEVVRDDEAIATLEVKVAAINLNTRRPMPFENWFIEAVDNL